jgi:hypothetical protein
MKLPDEFQFLTKLRFWTMVLAALMLYLQQKGWIGDAEALLLGGVSAAFWATQTVDRLGEKLGKTETEAEAELEEEVIDL